MNTAYRFLSILTALILFSAGVLKIIGYSISPVTQTGILLHPAIMVAVVEIELIIAAALFCGVGPLIFRNLTIGLFSLFAMVSAKAFYNGVSSCGCFGPIAINPLYVFLFDLGVVFAFFFCKPSTNGNGLGTLPLKGIIRPIIGGVLLSLIVIGTMRLFYPDTPATLASLRERTVVISPMVLDIGFHPTGTEFVSSINVSNYGNSQVYIAGGSSDCFCVVTEKLPCSLQGGEKIDLPVRIKLPEKAGSFHREGFLWTDSNPRKLTFNITGVIQK